ncbi:ABC transporter substrate-binding protein [Candidatus Mycolicibacterium alkanivorans]|uniref:ABC transporter substrate-binding protein n=1 Tax=Candidatus Mycolicibacterium alkanivorans TaxID=2954114 RepID=A0ABS9YXV0_9MYCO|nr:ABC transporter substrate-binding protein [Candidatus Mycolicibacterium alkanivorans]MCI4675932.1 ABC transporter substrate-binding protein [Candidatus Mycolicibacterium alkanivorans]
MPATQLHTHSSTLTFSNCPLPNALIVAQQYGFLADVGLELRVLTGRQGTTHFTYDRPNYTRFGGEIPPLVSEGLRARGRTRLLGVTPFIGRQGFYVAADSPIIGPAELTGRRIGLSAAAIRVVRRELADYRQLDPWAQTLVALGTWEARALLHTLDVGQVALDEVELVRVDNPFVDVPQRRLAGIASLTGADLFPGATDQQASLLDHGTVDALFGWLPWAAQLETRCGARLLTDLSSDPRNHYATVWTVSQELVTDHPHVVQQLVNAVVAAGLWAATHPEQVIETHADNLGVPAAAVTAAFGVGFHHALVPSLDADSLRLVERTQRFLLAHQLIDDPVPLDRWAAPQFLQNTYYNRGAITS